MADGCALDESPRSSATTRSAVKPRRKIPCFPLPNVVGPAMRAVGRGLSAGRTSSTRTHLAGPGAPAHREEELLGMSRVPDEIAVRGDGLLDPAAWQEPFAPLDASTCDEFHLSIGQSESFVGEGSPQPSPFSWLSEEQDHRSTADEGTQSTSSLSLSSCSESEAACRLAEPTQDVDAAVPSVCAALGDEVPVLGTDSDVGISATSSSAMGTIPAYPLPPTSSQPEMETREAQPQAPVVKICVVEQPFQPGRSAAAPKRLSPMPVAAASTSANCLAPVAPVNTQQRIGPERNVPTRLSPVPVELCLTISHLGDTDCASTGGADVDVERDVIAVALSPRSSRAPSETGTPRESDFGFADWQLDLFHLEFPQSKGGREDSRSAPIERSADAWEVVAKRMADLEMQVDFWKARADDRAQHSSFGTGSEDVQSRRRDIAHRRAGALELLIVMHAFRAWRGYARRLLEACDSRSRVRRGGHVAAQARRAAERDLLVASAFRVWAGTRL